jgi:hypothetical protein
MKTPDEVRLDVLDRIAETFRAAKDVEPDESTLGIIAAYHFVRGIAHEMYGIHLTSCKEGRRVGDARRRWDDEDES